MTVHQVNFHVGEFQIHLVEENRGFKDALLLPSAPSLYLIEANDLSADTRSGRTFFLVA
jgi:hypothetical protein